MHTRRQTLISSVILCCLLNLGIACKSIAHRGAEPCPDQAEPERVVTEEIGSGAAPVVSLGSPQPIASDDRSDGQLYGTVTSFNDSRPVESADCISPSWERDRSDFWDVLCNDVESLFTRHNMWTLAVAGGISFAFHETIDDDIAAATSKHPHRWGDVQDVIAGIGNPLHHLAFASGMYAYSLLADDAESSEVSRSLFNATALSTVSTSLLKFAANTRRPNGDPRGWPSGHTASSVAFAAVLNEYYGPWVGIPAYTMAGLVAWERIDDREHDLSDVFFGAAVGYVIGRTVATQHRARFCGFQVESYVDPGSGATGLGLQRHF